MFNRVSLRSRRAKTARLDLIKALGGHCARCPETRGLEFDCIVRQGPADHGLPWPQRIRWYWQQHLKGNIQLLCRTCHQNKTRLEAFKARAGAEYELLRPPPLVWWLVPPAEATEGKRCTTH